MSHFYRVLLVYLFLSAPLRITDFYRENLSGSSAHFKAAIVLLGEQVSRNFVTRTQLPPVTLHQLV